jgi:hypothetical protein
LIDDTDERAYIKVLGSSLSCSHFCVRLNIAATRGAWQGCGSTVLDRSVGFGVNQRHSPRSVMAFASCPRSLAVRLQRSAHLVTLEVERRARPRWQVSTVHGVLRKQRRSGRRMDAARRWERPHRARAHGCKALRTVHPAGAAAPIVACKYLDVPTHQLKQAAFPSPLSGAELRAALQVRAPKAAAVLAYKTWASALRRLNGASRVDRRNTRRFPPGAEAGALQRRFPMIVLDGPAHHSRCTTVQRIS